MEREIGTEIGLKLKKQLIKLVSNASKTKIIELDQCQENANIVIDNIHVERVQSFQYLCAMFITNGDCASNIKQRFTKAVQSLNNVQ